VGNGHADHQIGPATTDDWSDSGGATMLMGITDESWTTAQQVFAASCSRPEAKGTNDRRVLEALHYFRVHSITLRALPRFFGNWNSV
jgi:hypothetical protein